MAKKRRAVTKSASSTLSRKQQATSKRIQRVQDHVDPIEDAETQVDDIDVPDKPCGGGPLDKSVLTSFKDHVAAHIWDGKERGLLKLVNHGKKIDLWHLDEARSRIHANVVQSGLAPLIHCSHPYTNSVLISAFCERWQPETNSFHLPFGEMTITLDDVATILHIPVTGSIVSFQHLKAEEANAMLVDLLGVSPEEAAAETKACRGGSVRLHWLRERFGDVTDASSEANIQHATRAFLLYLIGCTLFVDKSAVYVSVAYLNLLRDLATVGTYAWGAACLAYLYRQLGLASRFYVHQIAGYLTLLQVWVYEHFPSLGPVAILGYSDSLPRAQRWKPRTYEDALQGLREKLDDLDAGGVCWEPYSDGREHHPLPTIAFYSGYIRCGGIIELYHPERVLWQFGYVQTIPPTPLATYQRGSLSGNNQDVYNLLDQLWKRWDMHLITEERRGQRSHAPGECSADYMCWFTTISHPIIQNPALRSGFQLGPSSLSSDAVHVSRAVSILQPLVSDGLEHTIEVWRKACFQVYSILRGSSNAVHSLGADGTSDIVGPSCALGSSQIMTPQTPGHQLAPSKSATNHPATSEIGHPSPIVTPLDTSLAGAKRPTPVAANVAEKGLTPMNSAFVTKDPALLVVAAAANDDSTLANSTTVISTKRRKNKS